LTYPGRKLLWLLLIAISLTACNRGSSDSFLNRGSSDIYLPPTNETVLTPFHTPEPSPTTGSQPSNLAFQPTSTPTCLDNLRYVADLTVPDGTQVSPGILVDKRWQVENKGTCNWDHNYRLKLIAGPDMGTPSEQALYPARSGNQAVIQIVFNAPADPGTYHSAWQAVSPQGQPFGDPIFLEIIVAPGG
jgi:Ig-like domain from next to BRCA1 gene